jgi:energy-converting hydrogenase Eha subunit A
VTTEKKYVAALSSLIVALVLVPPEIETEEPRLTALVP